MPRSLILLSLRLLGVLLATRSASLAQTAVFSPATMPPGTSGFVGDIKQDRQGYLWIAANPGLHRYNGYEWTSFLHDPNNPASLAHNVIETICPTRNGLVWVGTQGRGLDCLDPQTGRVISHHLLGGRTQLNMVENDITVLREGRDGTLWIGTHGGLYRRDPKTGRFTHYAHNPADSTSLSHNQVRAICEDRQGVIWVGTADPYFHTPATPEEGGLNRLDPNTGRFTRYRHDPANPHSLADNRIRAIFEDSRGTFWVGTYGDGLHTMDRRTGRFTRYHYDPAQPDRFSRPTPWDGGVKGGITFILEDGGGGIWIGTMHGGLNRFDPTTGQVAHYEGGQANAPGLTDNSFWSAYCSREGVVWFGSITNQLYRLPPVYPPLLHVALLDQPNALYQDRVGTLWVGTANGLFRQDAQATQPQRVELREAGGNALSNAGIFGMMGDRAGRLWLSTFGEGLIGYDPTTRTCIHYRHDPADPLSLPDSRIARPYEDRQGRFWVPTAAGLYQLNRQTGAFTPYRHQPNDSTALVDDALSSVTEDRQGNLWLGSMSGGGLKRIDARTGQITTSLSGQSTLGFWEDRAGDQWVVGNGILHRFDQRLDRFRPYLTPSTTQPIKNVESCFDDEQGNLWLVTTERRLVKITPGRDTVRVFGAPVAVVRNRFLPGFRGQKGEWYFGDSRGYSILPPTQLVSRGLPPPVVLTAFRLVTDSTQSSPEARLPQSLARTNPIKLAYHQNAFSFEFAALDYTDPKANQYLVWLEGYEPAYRPSGSDHRATYYNVPPGAYTFRVKATNANGLWAEKTITLVISPPWWRSWWAYALFALLAVGAVWGFIRYRSRALRRENRVLEEKVAHRTEQLERSLENLKVTQAQLIQKEKMASLGELTAGIAHEIQNPLNFVNNFAEVSAELVGELREEETKPDRDPELIGELLDGLSQNLEKITHHGSRASGIVRSMLEHSRTATGERQSTDLNALVNEYLRLAYHGFRAKDNEFDCELVTDLDPALGEVEVVPQDIGRVLLNLFNNAFYAVRQRATNVGDQEAYTPTVWVRTQRLSNTLEVRVKDNGTGMPDAVKAKIFQPFFTTKPTGQGTGLGLSLSYDVVTKGHGGTLVVDSMEREGTEFIITLPIS